MNGFVSAILTLLLSWIRSLANRLWLLLNTEGGGSFVTFLQAHWKTIFLAVCIGGFLLDRIIYLFRWRPYYVWGTKLGRLKRRLKGKRTYNEEDDLPDTRQSAPYASEARFALHESPHVPQENNMPRSTPYIQDDVSGHTLGFAPLNTPGGVHSRHQGSAPNPYELKKAEYDMNPIFDDATLTWTSPLEEQTRVMNTPLYGQEALRDSFEGPVENLGMHPFSDFGAARPEPAQYLQDIQSGFAPPITPEELYPPRMPAESEPIHPGLDSETFQQNIGLISPAEPDVRGFEEEPTPPQEADFPNQTFVSFYQSQDSERHSRNPFSNLARKARNLVSIHDEDNPPSIRDLRPTVDRKDAFHAPVFPQNSEEGNDG